MPWGERFRYLVAVGFAVCVGGLVVCANRVSALRGLNLSEESWDFGARCFGLGLLALFAVTLGLVIDAVVRFAFGIKSYHVRFSLRTLLICMTVFALLLGLIKLVAR